LEESDRESNDFLTKRAVSSEVKKTKDKSKALQAKKNKEQEKQETE